MIRKKLEDCLNVFLPCTVEVHHVDLNKENNQIENLIILRRCIHRKLHHAINSGMISGNRKSLQKYIRELGEPRKIWLTIKEIKNVASR